MSTEALRKAVDVLDSTALAMHRDWNTIKQALRDQESALATHCANYDALVIRLGEVTARLEAAEKDAKALRYAKTATVEFDKTIDGEHVGVIPFPHSAVGRKYKLVRITTHLKAADHV